MHEGSALTTTAVGEFELRLERVFAAPIARVFDAFTQPAWIQRWLLGPDGWSMPECVFDRRVGGAYRYVWRNEATGARMGAGGEVRELDAPRRISVSERFDEAWYPGECIVTNEFVEHADATKLSMTLRYSTRETRDRVLRSGMDRGVEQSFGRLEKLLAEAP